MTRHEIAILCCKLLALVMFAWGALLLTGSGLVLLSAATVGLNMDFSEGGAGGLLLGTLPAVIILSFGYHLWRNASWFAARMVSQEPSPVTTTNLQAGDLFSMALTVIGVLLLIDALRDLVAALLMGMRWSFSLYDWLAMPKVQADLWGMAVQLTASIWLILRARGIMAVIWKLQRYGREHQAQDS